MVQAGQCLSKNVAISGPLLLAKANSLALAMGDTILKALVCGKEEVVSPVDMEMWLHVTRPKELLDKFPSENICDAEEQAYITSYSLTKPWL